MKLHPRVQIVEGAGNDLADAINTVSEKYELTYGELTALLGRAISTNAKYQILYERQGDDSEKRGDEF